MPTNRAIVSPPLFQALVALAVGLAASCSMTARPTNPDAVELESYRISCDDAHRFAARSLKARGYRITAVDRSAEGGLVEGQKGSEESASIRISCGSGGVTIVPSGGLWQAQGMRLSFSRLVEIGDRIWPPPTGPQVRMELLVGSETKLEFPRELDSLGMTVVKVRVINGGARVIRIDPRNIRARSAGGENSAALPAAAVESRLGAVDPSIAEKILRPAKLRQGEEAHGFAFFPAGAYTIVVLPMIDDQTGEADEFEASLIAPP